jgi:cobalt-zinc-cadmium efflux system membrane fusion protein
MPSIMAAKPPPMEHDHAKEHADLEHHEDGHAKSGPHGGSAVYRRMVLAWKLLLSEDGGEADFPCLVVPARQAPARQARPKWSITLTRPGGAKQEILFVAPRRTALKSTGADRRAPRLRGGDRGAVWANAPFLASPSIQREGQGKIELSGRAESRPPPSAIEKAGASQNQNRSRSCPARIRFNEDRTAHVVPRRLPVSSRAFPPIWARRSSAARFWQSSPARAFPSSVASCWRHKGAFRLAKSTYEREKKLWEDKISAEQDYLQAQQALREAEIAVANSQQKLVALGTPASYAFRVVSIATRSGRTFRRHGCGETHRAG